jgi:hypothetical protein
MLSRESLTDALVVLPGRTTWIGLGESDRGESLGG